MYFDEETVGRRIKLGWPYLGIYRDIDGSFGGLGPNSTIAAAWGHNAWPECATNEDPLDCHIVCPWPHNHQRITFYQGTKTPFSAGSKDLHITMFDDEAVAGMSDSEVYEYLSTDNA